MVEIKSKTQSEYVKIAAVGIGGGGNNAVNRMVREGMERIDLISVNTDMQALNESVAPLTLQIGIKETAGMGAGTHAEVGEKSALESEEAIRNMLEPYQMVFITCGMGGGTGTGAAPVIAQISKEMGKLTVGIVTLPFEFEGKPRMDVAMAGIGKLCENVDTMIVIPNEKLTEIYPDLDVENAFMKADEVLHNTVNGICNIIVNYGLINLDFSDICTVLKDKGTAHIGVGRAKGSDAVREAIDKAINMPLLETSIRGAQHILLNIEGNVGMSDLKNIGKIIREQAGENVNILWGTVGEKKDNEEITVTMLATGINGNNTIEKAAEPRNKFTETVNTVEIPPFLRKNMRG